MTHLDILLSAPLIILGVGSLFLLMLGAFSNSARATCIGAAITIIAAATPLVLAPSTGPVFALDGGAGGHLMQVSPFTNIATLILLAVSLLCLPLVGSYFKGNNHKPEIYVLLVLALAGMVALISSAHMLTLYVALELMSFPIYILASIMRDDAKSSESGLKYYVLGSMASGLMLYGISLIFAGLGTLSFANIFTALNGDTITPVLLIGVSLTLLGSLFKLSVAPFHMWTPDVYEGAPTPVTAIMGAFPKIAAFVLLVRLLEGPFAALQPQWQPTLAWLAVASMLVGGTLAIVQSSLKRLLAFSTIANVGFVLVGVVAANAQGSSGVLLYIAIYAITTLGLFAALMASGATKVSDLKGLAIRNRWLAATFMLLLFSLAGIPPLAGFMAKLSVFTAAVAAGYNLLAIAGVLASVIALFYSLWLIKVMYFDQPETLTPTPAVASGLQVVMLVSAMLTLILGIFPTLLGNLTLAAATAIF
ncbi:MAG: NADH-quinone oxidoreductase subunit N [Pseudomonas fluorescens]|nr:MAG: NADH-quinone oxidoreductase subunit N [Pseudomonas fluorescens]